MDAKAQENRKATSGLKAESFSGEDSSFHIGGVRAGRAGILGSGAILMNTGLAMPRNITAVKST